MMTKFITKLKLTLTLFCLISLFGIIVPAKFSGQTDKFSMTKKINLIIRLVIKRINSDPSLKKQYDRGNVPRVESLPGIVLIGLPEGTIVTIVETYWMKKKFTSASDEQIIEAIERHRKTLFPESGNIPKPLRLSNYIKYRLKIEHSHGAPISNEFIEEAIKEANEAYR